MKTLMVKTGFTIVVLLSAVFAAETWAQTNIYSGQFTVGGGYTTILTLMNTGSTEATGTVFFTDQQGNPFTVKLSFGGEPVNSSTATLERIRSGSTGFATLSAVNAGDPIKSGWIRVEYTGGSLNGVATFLLTEGNTLKTIAGVLSAQPVAFATIPVDNSEAEDRFTGFAIANHNSTSLSVRLVTLNESGTIVDNVLPTQLNLAAKSQTAIFLHQILTNRLTFKGSMVLVGQSGQTFVAVALVVNRGLLTAIPVIPEKAPGVPN